MSIRLKAKDIMRVGHVNRFQIVRTQRSQTLGEHMYIVTMLAEIIFERMIKSMDSEHGMKMNINSLHLLLLKWGMRHDLPEVVIGDIATPVKRAIQRLMDKDPILEFEYEIDPEYKKIHQMVIGTEIWYIVKIADIIEAIVFLKTEGIGSHAKLVGDKLEIRFNKLLHEAQQKFNKFDWIICNNLLNEVIGGGDAQMDLEYE